MNTRNSILVTLTIFLSLLSVNQSVIADTAVTYTSWFNLPIPADTTQTKGPMTDAVLNIPNHHIIKDINIAIDITHTKVFDLKIQIKSPAGTTVELNQYDLDDYFDGANYTATIFDDQASTPIELATAPFTGRFRPKSPNLLSLFNGQDAFGQWNLQIHDNFFNDIGTLNTFGLMITIPEPATSLLFIIGISLSWAQNRRRK